jgi:outer membrane protein OmpA-like peptidoglycan-associated protein
MYKSANIKVTFICFIILLWGHLLVAQRVMMKTLFFAKNNYHLSDSNQILLRKIAQKCSSDSCGSIKIFAFADKVGSDLYNDSLSEKRANTVYDSLLSYAKIDTTIIYVQWFGHSTEVEDTHLDGLHVRQRAVDIYIQFNKKKKR